MEVTDGNLQMMVEYLQKTLTADRMERKGAEKFLESIEGNQNYPIVLLSLIDKEGVAIHIRVSASITFKNFVKRNWPLSDEGADRIHLNDREVIKKTIVALMLRSPEQIQKQLSDAISYIGKEDFPGKWPDLLDEMISKFTDADFNVINGILHTGHSIFKKYRHEFKSDKLWREIKLVLDKFALPFTQLTSKLMELCSAHANNPANLKVIYHSVLLCCKLFYSLNFQDLPEFFEDNMPTWMTHFHTLLTINADLIPSECDEEAGLMEQVKTQVCDNLTMYAQKYDEEFSPHLPVFVGDVWALLTSTGIQVKYDLLVSNAICFLATVAERPGYKKLFEEPGTLSSICEKVIVPNMQFRSTDEEAFEDNAEEYIRRDIEGSDVDTRRRAACDLVRALSRSFEKDVINNFSVYIQHMLTQYQSDPSKHWKSKDTAIFLVTSLAIKGHTQKHGTTQTSELINVNDFFNNHITPDLQSPNVDENAVIKADVIKFVMVFRSQLPATTLVSCIPHLIKHLSAKSMVVHSYAATALEKLMAMKPSCIGRAELSAYSDPLLTNLLTAFNHPSSHENDYLMKCLMRSVYTLQDSILPHLPAIVSNLLAKLDQATKNPSKPHFNHYLFESLCIVISIACRSNVSVVSSFEEPLIPLFQNILQQDVQEFVPYIFQVLALMLEIQCTTPTPPTTPSTSPSTLYLNAYTTIHPSAHKPIPPPYMALFPMLLQPLLWERSGNIPALVRLLQAYVSVGFTSNQIQADKLTSLLGIFQKLLASRSNDQFGMKLLNTIILSLPLTSLETYLHQIFLLIFQKLTTAKTTKFIKCTLVFFSLFSFKFSVASLISTIDKIQPRMFSMVVEKLFINEASKVDRGCDKKLVVAAMTTILCDPTFHKDPTYDALWSPLLTATIATLQAAPISLSGGGEDAGGKGVLGVPPAAAESEGFQTAYSQLSFSSISSTDPSTLLPESNHYIANTLKIACSTSQDLGAKLAGTSQEKQAVIKQLMNSAGIAIA